MEAIESLERGSGGRRRPGSSCASALASGHASLPSILLVVLLLCPGARADASDLVSSVPGTASEPRGSEAAISGDLSRLSDAEVERRLAFLVRRLDERQPYGRFWQTGFTMGWTLGIGIGALQASLSNDHDDRLNGALTASKAAIGVARLALDPTPARLGADPIREIEGEGPEALRERLRAGESQLARVAHRAERRYNWIAHAGNVALNTAAGLTVILYGNPSDAVTQIGVSTLAGELMLWTDPWKGAEDLEDYRSLISRTGRPLEPRPSWTLAPMPGGIAFRLEF